MGQINPNMPRTIGDGGMHISQLDYIVQSKGCIHTRWRAASS
jgi:hypothetical protein